MAEISLFDTIYTARSTPAIRAPSSSICGSSRRKGAMPLATTIPYFGEQATYFVG
jgi:hypothetical protein